MKKILVLLFLFAFTFYSYSQSSNRVVLGTITDEEEPLTDVNVEVVDKDIRTKSKKDGRYQIPVETGDIIAYTARGMEPLKIKVEDVTKVVER